MYICIKFYAHLIKKISALSELWSQWMVAPVHSEVKRKSLGEKIVPLGHMIEHVVSVYGRLHIAPEYL